MGLPSVITTDQGTEFRNQVNREIMQIFGVDHRLTTAYHPQANGLDERFNQTLVSALAKFSQEESDTWDEKLGEVVYGYNTAVQDSTQHTPFEVMFGRVARLPIDINMSNQVDPEKKANDYQHYDSPKFSPRETEKRRLEHDVQLNIEQAQKKQKLYYDRKHGAGACFSVGATVLKKDFRRKKRRGGRLDYRWEGPFQITALLGKGLYRLKKISGSKVISGSLLGVSNVLCKF